jgi:hypothetical protein
MARKRKPVTYDLTPHTGYPRHSCGSDIGMRLSPDEALPQAGEVRRMTASLSGQAVMVGIREIVEHRIHPTDGYHLLTVHGFKIYVDEMGTE